MCSCLRLISAIVALTIMGRCECWESLDLLKMCQSEEFVILRDVTDHWLRMKGFAHGFVRSVNMPPPCVCKVVQIGIQ
jgi:hypothetical protein